MSTLGVGLLTAGFLVCGVSVLVMVGLVRTPTEAVWAAGLAIFTGWTVTALALTLITIAGPTPNLLGAAVIWVLAAAGATIRWRLAPGDRVAWVPLRERTRQGRLLGWAGATLLSGCMALLLVRSWEPTGVLHADAWGQWLPKAKILYTAGLDTGPGGFTSQFNADYPPLQPTSEALSFHALGGADALDLPRVHWVIDACFLLGVAWLLAPRVRPAILWPSLAMLAVAPRFGWLVGSLLADEPAAMLIALAGLTAILWLLEGDRRYVPLVLLFLTTATLTKNEGMMLGLVIVVALALTPAGRREWRLLALLAAGVLAARGIWKIWLVAHDVPRNLFYDLGDLLHPGYLLGRADRLDYGLTQLLTQLATPSRWLLIVPAAFLVGAITIRRRPTLGIFVCAVVVLDALGFSIIYWVSTVDLHFYVDNTVDRLPAFIAVLSGVLLPLLLQENLPLPRADPAVTVPSSAAPCSTPRRTTSRRA